MDTSLITAHADFKVENDRTGLGKAAIKRAFLDNLFYSQGKFPGLATKNDYYMALAYLVRDRLLQRWVSTAATYIAKSSRTVAYLSAEYLMGPHLCNNLVNLGIFDRVKEAVAELNLDLDELFLQEEEPGLGNGGLGRLAACFLDSLATLEIPALGYGIRYEFGIFNQEFVDGWQVEKTDKWLRFGNPWEIARPEWSVDVKLGGYTEEYLDGQGRTRVSWHPGRVVKGVPYDTPILGYQTNTANTLRLWSAQAPESFDFAEFNNGNYYRAVEKKVVSENLTKVLYPNDEQIQGKKLRLEQQYFFVSCSLQDMLRILKMQNVPLTQFHEKFSVQLNDTHPAIAVAELMRLLVDEYELLWNEAWSITQKTFSYTNHTLMPEALERWSMTIFSELLPRHLQIIYEINSRFLRKIRVRFGDDKEQIARMSIIDENGERYIRMAHLACIGSNAINGVAQLHTELLKKDVLKDFYALWPQKFSNKTNGVTPRRWLVLSNPRLSKLITQVIGDDWIKDLDHLKLLAPHSEDASLREIWREVKRANKQDFCRFIHYKTGEILDPESLFDVQVKRIHEYKRQHLNILHVIAQFYRLKANPNKEFQPRTYIFGGKAAPGYYMAKLIIKLINEVGEVVNRDPIVRDRIKVVFVPNYNVTNGQKVYPAADLSEQISTAGKEASGTGNMKFSMNGALTIGTLDGANIEIREQVGADNFFLFGLTTEEVMEHKRVGYNPMAHLHANPELAEVVEFIRGGLFSRSKAEIFLPLIDLLLTQDHYMVMADFQSYSECQKKVDETYRDFDQWTRMSIKNVAASGMFSSDRTIQQYCDDIWKISKVPIRLLSEE